MKTKLFIAVILLVVARSFYFCSELKEEENVELTPCNHPLEQQGMLGVKEVKLFDKYSEKLKSPYILIDRGEVDKTFLQIGNASGVICNFPEISKNWTIPDGGLTVIIDGKVFETTSFHPADAMHSYFDLELTMLKLIK